MEYLGDFPPCQHRFIFSNGAILCQNCGIPAPKNESFGSRIRTAQGWLR